MAKANKTKYALLGVLNIISGSGYDIKKFCDSSIGFFWNENYGHIYPMLHKMEEEGLVTKAVEQTEGKPSKNLYSITKKGKEELNSWLKLPPEHQPLRSELLLKIFLSKDIPVKNIIENMEEIKKASEELLLQYTNVEKIINSKDNQVSKKDLMLWNIVLSNGKFSEEAKIKWCEKTIEDLKEIEYN